ncbi:MAG: LpqB family beta-propeller domain-containing protein, partial [Brevibacterium aurantiacum]
MKTPRRRKSLQMLILAIFATMALGACSSIPSSSPVGHIEAGSGDPGASSARIPDGPEPGDSIGEIVRGFLAAGAGTGNNFSVAKSFLTEAEAQEWNPQESVSILPNDTDLDSLNAGVTSDNKTLTMSAPV